MLFQRRRLIGMFLHGRLPNKKPVCTYAKGLQRVQIFGVHSQTWTDRKSTRLNSSHTVIYTLSLHDALPIYWNVPTRASSKQKAGLHICKRITAGANFWGTFANVDRSEEHTSELQSHRDLHSFPTRRSSDLLECSYTGVFQTKSRFAHMQKDYSGCKFLGYIRKRG